MARTIDRWLVSEALRLQKRPLWRVAVRTPHTLILVTDFDEELSIKYGNVGQVRQASYTHYDEHGNIASYEQIKHGKRARVLHLINQGNIVAVMS